MHKEIHNHNCNLLGREILDISFMCWFSIVIKFWIKKSIPKFGLKTMSIHLAHELAVSPELSVTFGLGSGSPVSALWVWVG